MRSRVLAAALAGAAAVGALASAALFLPNMGTREAQAPARPEPEVLSGLLCQFYVFVESRPQVAFMLEALPGAAGAYRQVYVAKADGDRTDYNALTDRTPEWRLAETEPRRLEAQVTVPDPGPAGLAEQEIAIEIPDFDPASPGRGWREASLKSVYYQNLPGKCRGAPAPGPAAGAS